MLVTRDTAMNERDYLLVTAEGRVPDEQVLDCVGDPVEISGRLEQVADPFRLRIAAHGVRRRSFTRGLPLSRCRQDCAPIGKAFTEVMKEVCKSSD
jgi:hypothetical protein